jgi:RNA recognition motif-containing protein
MVHLVKITIGNLSYRAVESDLRRIFSAHGPVSGVSLSRGSASIEMREPRHAASAVHALDGRRIHGRPIRVAEAGLAGSWLMDVQEEYADFVR